MSATPALSAAQAEVHAEIGRSLVFFQQLERAEKMLLKVSGASVIVALAPTLHSPAAPGSKATFGQLTEPLLEHVLQGLEESDIPALPSDGIHPSVSFHLSVPLSDEQRDSIRSRLQRAVAVRNDIVHHSLDWIQLGTVEQCHATCDRLRRERAEFESLLRMFQAILAPLPELMRRTEIELRNQLQAKLDSAGDPPAAPTRRDT